MKISTGNSGFAVCHRHSAKPTKHSANSTRHLQCRQTTICRVFFIAHSANGLSSVKFDTQQKKWFFECFSKIHSAKDYCLPSVFGNYTRQTYFPKKKIFFFSAKPHVYTMITNYIIQIHCELRLCSI